MGVAARLDGFQRRHTWLGFPLAVIYKFIDDQGGYLASLITQLRFPRTVSLAAVAGQRAGLRPAGQPRLAGAGRIGAAATPDHRPATAAEHQRYPRQSPGRDPGHPRRPLRGLNVSVAIQTTLNRVWARAPLCPPQPTGVPTARPGAVRPDRNGRPDHHRAVRGRHCGHRLPHDDPAVRGRLRGRHRGAHRRDRGRGDRQCSRVPHRVPGAQRPRGPAG